MIENIIKERKLNPNTRTRKYLEFRRMFKNAVDGFEQIRFNNRPHVIIEAMNRGIYTRATELLTGHQVLKVQYIEESIYMRYFLPNGIYDVIDSYYVPQEGLYYVIQKVDTPDITVAPSSWFDIHQWNTL